MFTPRTETEWLVDTLRMDGLDAWVADEAGRVIATRGTHPDRIARDGCSRHPDRTAAASAKPHPDPIAMSARPDRYVLLTQSETGENWRVTLTAAGVPRRDVVGVPLHEAARLALDLLEEEA